MEDKMSDKLTSQEMKLRLERILLELEFKTDYNIQLLKEVINRNELIKRLLQE